MVGASGIFVLDKPAKNVLSEDAGVETGPGADGWMTRRRAFAMRKCGVGVAQHGVDREGQKP